MSKLDSLSDEQLIAQFARHADPAALGELARRHERSLLGLACGMLGGRQDLARDAIQETWIRVIRFARTFHGRSTFKTWLYRIAINQSRNARKAMCGNEVVPTAGPSPVPNFAAPFTEHVRVESSLEMVDQLRRCVDDLSEDKQMVLLLCYHRGMTHELAAEILEIPLGTLKSRLHSALNELRRRFAVELQT